MLKLLDRWTPVFLLGVVLWIGYDAIRDGDAFAAFLQGLIAGLVVGAIIVRAGRRRRR